MTNDTVPYFTLSLANAKRFGDSGEAMAALRYCIEAHAGAPYKSFAVVVNDGRYLIMGMEACGTTERGFIGFGWLAG